MNCDDIIRMARAAGGTDNAFSDAMLFDLRELERFAALVAAAERKTCEVACAQALEYAKLAEREMCAKVCEINHGKTAC